MKSRVVAGLLTMFIIVGVVSQLTAQEIEIDCGDELIIQDGIDIQFPNVSPTDQHTITVIGLDNYDAVLAVFNQQQSGGCDDNSVDASGYTLDFPTTGVVTENEWNAQREFRNSNFMRVVVGDYEDLAGEFVLMVEGLTYDGNPDLINMIVTADMIQSGLPVTAYVMERTEGLDLSLALVDDNGVPLRDNVSEPIECDDAGDVDSCWGAHQGLEDSMVNISGTVEMSPSEFSPMLSVPLTPNDEQTIIPFQIKAGANAAEDVTGDYVFLLHVGAGDLFLADGIASAANSDVGTQLTCDEEIWLSDAIDITFPRVDSEYVLSILGQDFANSIMAVMDRVGGGLCYSLALGNDEMAANLPLIDPFERSATAIRTSIFTETAQILTGLVDDATGSYLFAIEGMSIPPDGTEDVVSVKVTEGMVASGQPITVYMIADTLDLNPQLALVSAEGEILTDANESFIVCFDSGSPDGCWGEFEDMDNAEIILHTNRTLQGLSDDVMLRIPLTPDLVDTTLNFMSGRVGESFGTYTLILHVPVGSAATSEQE